jgi:branched-chain amino acid transport system substrate-binding protein
VIYPDDAFGTTVLQGVQAALRTKNAEPVASASYARQTTQVDDAIEKVKSANPDAVVVVGPSNTVRLMRKVGSPGLSPSRS